MHKLLVRSVTVCLAAVCLTAPVWAAGGPAGRIIPMHHDQLVFPDEDTPHRECICAEPSQRNLLQRERAAVYAPGQRAGGAATAITLNVLAIRVAFPYEEPDDPLTTGRGTFDMRDTAVYFAENLHNFDSSPHDKRYFETHLRALNLYWNTVSNGELTLNYTVFPYAADSVYQMPNNMSYYGRDRGADSGGVGAGLEEFVVDAATAAAEDPSIVFENYDAVIIFHPGSDRQSDIAQDTPNDLFTAFVHLGQFISLSAGASDVLQEAIIMPETMIQDNRITVMNSVMAHEFGHQLGLVDLYNTRSFLTQVGNFSLMDNNAMDVGVDVEVAGRRRIMFGALPVFPDAWSRYFLGFVSANRVVEGPVPFLPTAEEQKVIPQTTPQVVKIPISETEYYLCENRRFDIDGLGDAALRLDSMTNVVLEPVDTLSITANREYDFLLPGQGMLVWHVDEGVAALDYVTDDDTPNNFLANTLQWDSERRFLHLLEADGLINFGGFFSAGTGSAADYFFYPHNDSIGPLTNPPTASNTGGRTGITIHNISRLTLANGQMSFDVSRDGFLSGFPVYCGADTSQSGAPMVTDLTPPTSGTRWRFPGDGRPEIFLGYKNYILGFDWEGNHIGGTPVLDSVERFDTSFVTRTIYPLAMGDPADEWVSPPMIVNSGVSTAVLVAVSRTGNVYAWNTVDDDGDGLFDVDFTGGITGPAVSGAPIVWNRGGTTKEIFVPVQSNVSNFEDFGILDGIRTSHTTGLPGLIVSAAGTSLENTVAVIRDTEGEPNEWWVGYIDGSYPPRSVGRLEVLGPSLGDIDRDSLMEAVVITSMGRLIMLNELLDDEDGFPVDVGFTPSAAPVLADVDRDGYLDIVVVGSGMMAVYARNGALLPNFPVVIGPLNEPDTALATPAIAGIGESDRLGLFSAGERPVVNYVDGRGGKRDDFPRPLGGASYTSPAWAHSTADNEAAIFTRTDDGYLYANTTPVTSSSQATAIWPMAYRNPSLTNTVGLDDLEPLSVDDQFFVAERAFVYPNPASDQAVVRYWLGDDASVRIRIFDFAGNLVIEANGPGDGGAYNEWTWNCNNAASGVYFAHVEVTGLTNNQKETVLCKMAVVQ